MRDFAVNVAALLVSISLLLLGNGLTMTLLGVRAQMEGFSTVITGFLMSAYFIGYIFGALSVPKMVTAVGHVRVFAALASITSVSAILHVVWIDPYFWAILRILTGFCLVGLYLVTESWLNEQSSNENRGQVFSAYMIINLGSVAMGQQLLQLADPAGIGLFVIGTVLFSLAVVPLSLVPARAPQPIPGVRMKIRSLYKISPVGTVGAFCSGLVNGAFWGMAPVYLFQSAFTTSQIANVMMAAVLGGMFMQWPLGRFSDKTDRRNIIMLTCVGFIGASLLIANTDVNSIVMFFIAIALLGGFMMPLGALCNAHANDHLEQSDFVQASGTILMVSGIGAIIGPYAASILMQIGGETMLFIFCAIVAAVLLLFTACRRFVSEAPDKTRPFRALPMATHYIARMQRNRSIKRTRKKKTA